MFLAKEESSYDRRVISAKNFPIRSPPNDCVSQRNKQKQEGETKEEEKMRKGRKLCIELWMCHIRVKKELLLMKWWRYTAFPYFAHAADRNSNSATVSFDASLFFCCCCFHSRLIRRPPTARYSLTDREEERWGSRIPYIPAMITQTKEIP